MKKDIRTMVKVFFVFLILLGMVMGGCWMVSCMLEEGWEQGLSILVVTFLELAILIMIIYGRYLHCTSEGRRELNRRRDKENMKSRNRNLRRWERNQNRRKRYSYDEARKVAAVVAGASANSHGGVGTGSSPGSGS